MVNKERKRLGAIPTPIPIVDFIVSEIMSSIDKNEVTRLNILDTSVGDGRFLFAYNQALKSEEQLQTQINYFGIDINHDSIEIAQIEKHSQKNPSQFHFRSGNSLLGFLKIPKLSSKLSKSDFDNLFIQEFGLERFIKAEELKKMNLFHWGLELPAVFEDGGFDIIIGNPPFGANYPRVLKNVFKHLYKAIDPEIESYLLFIERSIDLLKNKGFLGLIVPNNLATNQRYEKIRKLLVENGKILKFLNIQGQVFPQVHIDSCILIYQKEIQKELIKKHKICFRNFYINKAGYLEEFKSCDLIDQSSINKNHFNILIPVNSFNGKKILDKISKTSTSLDSFVKITRGIELGYNSIYTSHKKLNENYVPLLAGRNVKKYQITGIKRYIEFDSTNKAIFKDKNVYTQPRKILLRRIGHNLIGTIDSEQNFCVCDVYIISIKEENKDLNLNYLIAIINSSLMEYYFTNKYVNLKKIFPKISLTTIKTLPIPNVFRNYNEIVDLVAKLMKTSQSHLRRNNILNQIDYLVFLEYGLDKNERMYIHSQI